MRYKLLYIITASLYTIQLVAQPKTLATNKYEIADGDEFFAIGNFVVALDIYKKAYETLPNNRELNYKLALCYLNTNQSRVEAVKHLEYVVKDEKAFTEAWYHLGIAYSLDYKLDEAIKALQKFQKFEPKKSQVAERKIEQCNNAKELMKHPVNVSFTHLGKEINSPYPDYYPWITKDENLLVFTSRRKGNIGGVIEGDGYYPSDIYMSKATNGKWEKTKNIGPSINTAMDEQAVGLKADGSEIFIYIDHYEVYGNIFSSKKKGNAFLKMQPFNERINKKMEYSGSVSEDGSILFFVRKESEKETENTDIFMAKKLPSGEWAEPQKLGNEINTAYNEEFPYLATDGKTLYFSSEGHNSMGGFDLFKSEWNENDNSWSKAVNLGYPINTTDDDKSISISADNKTGYISASRSSGFGDLDIYRLKFKKAGEKLIIYKGAISVSDSLTKKQDIIASITVTEKTTHEEYSFTPHSQTGAFVMLLPEGTYDILLTSKNYKEIKEKLEVNDIGNSANEHLKNYILIKNK